MTSFEKVEKVLKEREILQSQIIKGLNESNQYLSINLEEWQKKHIALFILREIRKNNETGGTY